MSSSSVTVNAGTLEIATTGRLGGGNYSQAITNNGTFIYSGANDQSLSGIISGTGALTQNNSSSTLTLSGNNTYTGATTVSQGVLNIQHANALGTTAAGTTVSSGAALQIQGSITVGAEALSLAGNGVSTDGALRNISGDNTYGGAITLTGATRINSDAGNLTLSGGISGATQNLTIGGSGNTTISGAIGTTTGTLTKDGLGTLSLNATNTYTGATTINAGTLQTLTANVISDSSAVSVASGATFVVGGNDTVASIAGAGNITLSAVTLTAFQTTTTTFSGVISGAGNLTKSGSGTLTLSGNNADYSGTTAIKSGTLLIGHDSALGTGTLLVNVAAIASNSTADRTINTRINQDGSASATFGTVGTGNLTFTNTALPFQIGSGAFTFNVNNTFTQFNNAVTEGGGSRGLIKNGSGTLILNGANTYSNTTTINAGTLQIGAGSTTGTLSTSSSITNNATLTFNRSADTTQGTHFSNNITGTGNLIKMGSGNLTLSSSNNTYTGTTSVLDGTLILSGTLSNSSVIVNGASATLNQTSSGSIGGTGATFTLTNGNATLAGANTYTGATTINAGTLSIAAITNGGVAGALGNSTNAAGNLVLGGGTLQYTGSTSNSTDRNFTLTAGTTSGISVTNSATSLTISGTSAATSGNLTKSGAGTLVLSGVNNHTGATTIDAGTLDLTGSISSSATTINSGGTLIGTGTAGAVTVNSSGTIGAGNAAGSIGTLTVGSLILNGGSTYTWDFGNINGTAGTNWDLLSVTNTLTINATSGNKFTVAITGTPTGWAPATEQTWNIINYGSLANAFDSSVFAYTTTLAGAGTWSFIDNGTFIGLKYSVSPTSTWTGGSGNWDSGFNTQPLNGNALVFSGPGGTATNNIASGNLTNLTTITINSGAGSYTLAANSGTSGFDASTPLTITGVTNNSANATTVNLALAISTSSLEINAAAGNITMGGPIANNNIITFSGDNSTTVSGEISGTGAITKNGNGTLTLSAANTYNGTTTISAGTLTLSGGLSGSSVTVTGNSTVFNQTSTGSIAGAGTTFTLTSGNATLAGTNTYTGATTISAGTLELAGSLGTGATYAGNISNNGTFTLNTTTAQTLSGNISGSGALVKSNNNNLTLSGNNTFTGGLTLNTGTLTLGSNATLGAATSNFTINGGSIDVTAARSTTNNNAQNWNGDFTFVGSNTLNLGTGNVAMSASRTVTVNASTLTVGGVISGAGFGLTKAGAGNLTLSGANTYTGATTINAGTLSIAAITNGGVAGALGNSTNAASNLVLGGGTLEYTGSTSNSTDRNFTLTADTTSGISVTNSTGSLTISGTSATTNGSLTKSGAGTLILSVNNTYTGTTTINAGTLQIGAGSTSGNLSSSSAIINNGTLVFNRSDAVTIGSVISGSGNVTQSGSASAALTLSNNNNSYTGTTTISSGSISISSIGNVGENSAIGAGSFIKLGSGSNTATLVYTGSSASTTNKTIDMSGTTGTIQIIQSGSGNLLFTSNFTASGSGAKLLQLRGAGAGAAEISGSIVNSSGGATNISKLDTGTWTLSGNNSFTGNISISVGSISISSIGNVGENSAAGAGSTITIGTSGAAGLIYTGGAATSNKTIALGGTSGAVSITQNGTGLLKFTNTGNLTAGAGSKTLTLRGSGLGELAGGIVNNNSTNITSLTKADAGTWTLTGNNTYTGVTTISGGTLQFAKTASLYNSATANWTAASIIVNNGATLALNVGNSTNGEFTQAQVNTLLGNLTGSNSSPTTGMRSGSTFGFDTTNADGGSFTITGVVQNGNSNGNQTVNLTKLGTGTLILAGSNTCTGTTTVSAGTLQLATAASLYNGNTASWTASNIIVNTGATLALNVGSSGGLFTTQNIDTIDSLGGASTGFMNNSTLALDTSNAGGSFTYSGNISNTNGGSNVLNLAKLGTGTLVLSGNNTYTGTTTISVGTLEIASTGRLGGGS